jgi:hypothetical protein
MVLSGGNIDVTMLSRIIERGLVKDGRLVRLGVLLRDRPGELARLTALIAEARANIVHIEHDRAFARWAGIGETEVELTLETSGREHLGGAARAARGRRLPGGGAADRGDALRLRRPALTSRDRRGRRAR